jgi:hypothetical protein
MLVCEAVFLYFHGLADGEAQVAYVFYVYEMFH